MTSPRRNARLAVVVLSACALLVGALLAGCGGSTGKPVGTGTGAADTAPGGKTRDIAFSDCMRAHGVPDFPDPAFTPPTNAPRVLVLRGMVFAIPSSVDPKAPAFQQAARACRFGIR